MGILAACFAERSGQLYEPQYSLGTQVKNEYDCPLFTWHRELVRECLSLAFGRSKTIYLAHRVNLTRLTESC